MVDCDWIILCDYALQAAPGKLCMIGVFDIILTRSLPARHPRAAIGFSITGEPGESGDIKLEIIGPTGQIVMTASTPFTLPDSGSAQVHLEIANLVLTEWGRHAIQIDLGETFRSKRGLRLNSWQQRERKRLSV